MLRSHWSKWMLWWNFQHRNKDCQLCGIQMKCPNHYSFYKLDWQPECKQTLVFMILSLMHKQSCLVQRHRNLVVVQLSSSNPNVSHVSTTKVMWLTHPALHVSCLCLYLCSLINKAFIHLLQQLNQSYYALCMSKKGIGKNCISERRTWKSGKSFLGKFGSDTTNPPCKKCLFSTTENLENHFQGLT